MQRSNYIQPSVSLSYIKQKRKTSGFKTRQSETTEMRKCQKRKPITQDLEDGEELDTNKENRGFYACYLLTSLCPRFKGHTYIGFTVNPKRRIRQHNGEIRCGAFRTKKRRPWEMVLCLYGFPTNVSALQFEWAWQHPMESLAVRQAAATFKTFSGIANKIKLAYTMLNLPSWKSLNITVNYFSTLYMKHHAASPSLPEHMKVQVLSMDDLPCYSTGERFLEDDDAETGFDEELQACGTSYQPTNESRFDETLNIEELDETLNIKELQTRGTTSQPSEIEFEDTLNIEKLQACGIDSMPTTDSWPNEASNMEKLQHCGINSQLTTASSSLVSFLQGDSATRNILPFVENNYKLDSPQRSKSSSKASSDESTSKTNCWSNFSYCETASDEDQHPVDSPVVCHQIEVIDLLSPSPDCRISFINKKRRVSVVCPVIDLT